MGTMYCRWDWSVGAWGVTTLDTPEFVSGKMCVCDVMMCFCFDMMCIALATKDYIGFISFVSLLLHEFKIAV